MDDMRLLHGVSLLCAYLRRASLDPSIATSPAGTAECCSAQHVDAAASFAGRCQQNCTAWPRALCHHKPHSHTATLSVLDFRSAEKWVRPRY